MSNKDPKSNKNINTINDDIQDRRDTELTFLKKVNEEYELRLTPSGSEQGEKRIRTASDEEYDKIIKEYGSPKRPRSSQRKTRTITNSYYTATATSNYNNISSRIDKMDNELNNSQQNATVKTGDFKFKITRNAITYAVEQNLPAIRLECEPKLNEHKDGAALIKELIKVIEDDFKKINPKIKTNSDIGFDTWFIDNKETRWTGKEETATGDFIWSGEENIHANGIGFLLSRKAKNALIGYNPVSSRVITARFNATAFKITAIHVYAPTSASSDEEIEAFYNSIENTLAKVPKKDLILMSGDWNAKVGNDNTGWNSVMGRYGFGDRNDRGERLLDHDGNLLQSKEAIKKRWTQYCSNLYKDNGGGDILIKELEQISPPIQQESHDILFSEVEQAIQSLKKNKSPGLDGIQAELLQIGEESLAHEIHKLCNKIWHSEAIPEDWGNLFVFLCDVQHVPNKIINTNVKVILPKHLPPKRSIIIKGVPNSLCIEDIKIILAQKFATIYTIDEIPGTNNGKSRYVRMDLLSEIEYQQILNSGIICMEGQCLHVVEYLAAPRVLFFSKCNEPGHSKKNCSFDFERCRRCGGDRNVGQHNECEIRCHNCKEEHLSTDYKCVAVQCYRRDLIQHIQQHPESLPNDIQLFIPSQYRRQGDKTISNRNVYTRQTLDNQQLKNKINSEEWPLLPPSTRSTISYSKYSTTCSSDIMNNFKLQLNQIEINCALAKEEYDRKNMEIKSQISSSINQIQSLITCCSSIIQKQNEAIAVLKNAIYECLEFNRVTNQALCFIMDKSGDQQYVEISKQLSSIPFVERQSSINKLFSTYAPILDEFTIEITRSYATFTFKYQQWFIKILDTHHH
ncbi:unnamed protein product [Rotaria sp. Silwood1]|nr:unnamed protein product [Rotaria sp. Silwood1]